MKIKINDIKWGKPNNDNTQLPTEIIMDWEFDDPEHMEWDWELIAEKLSEQYDCDICNFNMAAEEDEETVTETVAEEDDFLSEEEAEAEMWRTLLMEKKSQVIEELKLLKQEAFLNPGVILELCLRKNGDFAVYKTQDNSHLSGDIVNGELLLSVEQHRYFWLEGWLHGRIKNIGKLKLPKEIENDVLWKWETDEYFGFEEMADYLAIKYPEEYIRLLDKYTYNHLYRYALLSSEAEFEDLLEYLS